MTKKNDDFYILSKTDSGYDVLKIEESSKGAIKEKSKYHLIHGAAGYLCDCPGYLHRKECKHVSMPEKNGGAKSVSLSDARNIVTGLIHDFRPLFKAVKLPDEPYERDESGMVKRITIELHGCVNIDTLLKPGVWEGPLKGSEVLLRLVIS